MLNGYVLIGPCARLSENEPIPLNPVEGTERTKR